jgi:peptidoglycan/LPS O-acetylase OafA/YrhL
LSAAPVGVQAPGAAPNWLRRFLTLEPLDNRYPALHGLRVVAIVSVVQLHVTAVLGVEQKIALDNGFVTWSMNTFFGMDMFFLLSGFLIGSILLHALRTTGSQNLRRFYLRRVLRTFPSYYLVLSGLALALPLTAIQRHNLPFEFLYCTNYFSLKRGHAVAFWGWSLALEEQFYLSVPLLFWALSKLKTPQRKLTLIFLCWLIPLGFRLHAYYFGGADQDEALHHSLYFRSHTRCDPIIAGIFVAVLEGSYHQQISAWLELPRRRAYLALVALTCVWLLYEPNLFGSAGVHLVRIFHWGTVTSVLHVLVLLLLLHGNGAITEFLARPIFRRIATVGYGIYLLHLPLLDYIVTPAALAAVRHGIPMIPLWICALVATMALSIGGGYVMHILVEKPALWLRHKLAA